MPAFYLCLTNKRIFGQKVWILMIINYTVKIIQKVFLPAAAAHKTKAHLTTNILLTNWTVSVTTLLVLMEKLS